IFHNPDYLLTHPFPGCSPPVPRPASAKLIYRESAKPNKNSPQNQTKIARRSAQNSPRGPTPPDVHRRSPHPNQSRRRRQRLHGLPPRKIRPPWRTLRRRRRPRRRHPHALLALPQHPHSLPLQPRVEVQRGGHGLGSNMSGTTGEPTVLNVPVGTLIYDEDTGELIH